jgi:hypothetical protein
LNRIIPSSRQADRRFFAASALAISVLCFAGFARSYYLRAWLGKRALPPILHLHGLIMTAWIVLFVIQIAFVAKNRIELHRRLGVAGALLAAVIVGLGASIVVHDVNRQSPEATTAAFWALFVAFDGINLMLFAGFVFAAVSMRRRSDIHKRLMLMATLSLLPPALGRIAIHFVPDTAEPITKLALLTGCLALVLLIDTFRHRRLHPAFGWGIATLLAADYATYLAQIST